MQRDDMSVLMLHGLSLSLFVVVRVCDGVTFPFFTCKLYCGRQIKQPRMKQCDESDAKQVHKA